LEVVLFRKKRLGDMLGRAKEKTEDNKDRAATFGRKAFGRKAFGRKAFSRKAFGRKAFSRKAFGRKAFGRKAFGRLTFRTVGLSRFRLW
jgi:hypothetical protein